MMQEEGPYRIDTHLIDEQLMDMIADDPKVAAQLEDMLKLLAQDPEGKGPLAGKIYQLCGEPMDVVDGAHWCVKAPGHGGEHSNTEWQDSDDGTPDEERAGSDARREEGAEEEA